MGVPIGKAAQGVDARGAGKPAEQVRSSRKFQCFSCGKWKPKSWQRTVRWLTPEREHREGIICRKCDWRIKGDETRIIYSGGRVILPRR